MNIHVSSIDKILKTKHLAGSYDKAIIFVSKRPNYYDFGCTPFFLLDVEDKDNYDDIKLYKVLLLIKFIKRVSSVSDIYIACDAGICRSPALAIFAADLLNKEQLSIDIEACHPHWNQQLYYKLTEVLNDNNSN